ncbi:MAG: HTH domain-containing protein [Flavobacteriaceae bacterium]
MKLHTHIERIKRVNVLIRREATGTPLQLAEKLNVSKATANRLIRELKDMGAPIVYCKHCESYRYTEVGYNFEF